MFGVIDFHSEAGKVKLWELLISDLFKQVGGRPVLKSAFLGTLFIHYVSRADYKHEI